MNETKQQERQLTIARLVERREKQLLDHLTSYRGKFCSGCRLVIGDCMCETPKPRIVYLNYVQCPDCRLYVAVKDWSKHRNYMGENRA